MNVGMDLMKMVLACPSLAWWSAVEHTHHTFSPTSRKAHRVPFKRSMVRHSRTADKDNIGIPSGKLTIVLTSSPRLWLY